MFNPAEKYSYAQNGHASEAEELNDLMPSCSGTARNLSQSCGAFPLSENVRERERGGSLNSGLSTLDRRLNPNAAEFVPGVAAPMLANKFYKDLTSYSNWSESNNGPFGLPYDAIWRESLPLEHEHPIGNTMPDPVPLQYNTYAASADTLNMTSAPNDIKYVKECNAVADTSPTPTEAVIDMELLASENGSLEQKHFAPSACEAQNGDDIKERKKRFGCFACHIM